MSDYAEFLRSKRIEAPAAGIDIDESDLNPALYPFQRAIVRWALRRGRAALFEDCGLGKTLQQLDWAQQIHRNTGGRVLIIAPLAVSAQTQREGARFGIPVEIDRDGSSSAPLVVTNYERVHYFRPSDFVGVVLDESSILKNFTGKIKQRLVEAFEQTTYRLACTATPAPNDHMEIGNHSEFLGVMPSNEMLARWFINDTMHFGSYRLKGHAKDDFWRWVRSWAVCIRKPSDIGFDDEGFDLPPFASERHLVRVDGKAPEGMLFLMPSLSATDIHSIMRLTAPERADRVAQLVNESAEPWVVWCHTNYEADELRKRIPDGVEIRGSDPADLKESRLIGFADGSIRALITKPSIAGFGMNWQHCARMAFVGMSYSYEQYYQATRRCWRFGQTRPVTAHVVMAEQEVPIFNAVMRKEEDHREMQDRMYTAGGALSADDSRALIDSPRYESESGEGWEVRLGDACDLIRDVPAGTVGLTVFSPPFSSLYIYSDSLRDMGNSRDDDEFFEHFQHMLPDLYRVTRPGRLVCVHCKDLVYYKNQRGTAGLRDFPGELTRVFQGAGFDYHSKVTIWKDPVTEMQRTKAHGLLHKQLCADSTFSRQGLPDYLLMFRRWVKSEREEGAVEAVARNEDWRRFTAYIGEDGPDTPIENDPRAFSIEVWQRYASPVWFDIAQMRVLNAKMARDNQDEKHICPLQLDVIERCIHLWSNPGDLVFDPFGGIGSTGVSALRLGRKALLLELKPSYFREAAANCLHAASEHQPGLEFAE